MNVVCNVLMSAGQNQQCQSLHKTLFLLLNINTFAKVKNAGWKYKQIKKINVVAKYMLYTAVWAKNFFAAVRQHPHICGQSVCMKFFSR